VLKLVLGRQLYIYLKMLISKLRNTCYDCAITPSKRSYLLFIFVGNLLIAINLSIVRRQV